MVAEPSTRGLSVAAGLRCPAFGNGKGKTQSKAYEGNVMATCGKEMVDDPPVVVTSFNPALLEDEEFSHGGYRKRPGYGVMPEPSSGGSPLKAVNNKKEEKEAGKRKGEGHKEGLELG